MKYKIDTTTEQQSAKEPQSSDKEMLRAIAEKAMKDRVIMESEHASTTAQFGIVQGGEPDTILPPDDPEEYKRLEDGPYHDGLIKADTVKTMQEKLAQFMVPTTPLPPQEVLLALNGVRVIARKDKVFVTGASKSMKTTTAKLLTATLCGHDARSVGFDAAGNVHVVYIDTEQSQEDAQRILLDIAKLCNKSPEEMTERLTVLSVFTQTPEEIRAVIVAALEEHHPDVLVLDNWTDCVSSILADKECVEFAKTTRRLAERYNMAILSVIHANEGKKDNPEFRGWASEEARKGDLSLAAVRIGESTTEVRVQFCRHKAPSNFKVGYENDTPCFIQSDMPSSLPLRPVNTKANSYQNITSQIADGGISNTALVNIIMEAQKVTDRTAARWIDRMCDAKAIVVAGNVGSHKRYYRADDPALAKKSVQQELPMQ